MTYEEFQAFLSGIQGADRAAMDAAAKRQAELAKPPGSLGELETMSIRLAGITGKVKNRIEKTRIAVFAADNGVVAEGISCTPMSVTTSQAINMTMHKTGMSTLAKFFGSEVNVVDVGINADYRCPEILNRKIRYGTSNLYEGPAMTREEALQALEAGIEQARLAKKQGIDALGIGEMGIGNTTTSAAVLAVLTGCTVEEVTGRGGGLTDAAFAHKKEVITHSLEINQPNPADPLDVLSKVGGFDLTAMTGAFIGCAYYRVPVVVDGYISIVAALAAVRFCPLVRDYLFLSHASFEVGYQVAEKELGLKASLLLGMRLGEGSGCPILFQILRAACAVMCDMATFPEAAINDDYLTEIRRMDAFTVKKS